MLKSWKDANLHYQIGLLILHERMFRSIISLCSNSEQLPSASLNQTWRVFVIVFHRGWQKGECFVEGLWIKIILCIHQWHHSSITNDFLCYLHNRLDGAFCRLSWNYNIIQFKCRCSACILKMRLHVVCHVMNMQKGNWKQVMNIQAL